MRKTTILAATLAFSLASSAKEKPQLTIEVVQAETVHGTTYWHDNGSAGTTKTDCDIYDSIASCTSNTTGARPASATPIITPR